MVKVPIAGFLIYGLLSAAVYLVKPLAPNPNRGLVALAHIGRICVMWIVVAYFVASKSKSKSAYTSQVSIRRILGNGYGVLTSCTVLGPSERKMTMLVRIYKFGDLEVLES
ncbi:hypothetical protein Tco_0138089 [Tanacetum coccineum]